MGWWVGEFSEFFISSMFDSFYWFWSCLSWLLIQSWQPEWAKGYIFLIFSKDSMVVKMLSWFWNNILLCLSDYILIHKNFYIPTLIKTNKLKILFEREFTCLNVSYDGWNKVKLSRFSCKVVLNTFWKYGK